MASFARKHSKRRSWDVAAWLVRHLTVATLCELAEPLGLRHPDNVRGLLGRVEAAMNGSAKLRKGVGQLRREIQHQTGSSPPIRRKKHE